MVIRTRVSADKYSQAILDNKHASSAKSSAGLQEGIGAAQGFATPAGEQTLSVPGIGSI